MKKTISFALCAAALAVPAIATAADGEAVYDANCAVCHSHGVAGAPRLGDKQAWASAVAKGREALIDYATNGPGHVTWDQEQIPLGTMPAKGGAKDLSAEEIAAAVDYMLKQAK